MLTAVLQGELSMASKDKALARVSDWTTLVMMSGLALLPLIPSSKVAPVRTKAPSRVTTIKPVVPPPRVASTRPVVTPAPAQSATPAPAVAPAPSATAPNTTKPADAPAAAAESAAPEPDVWTDAEQAAGLRECLRLLAPVNAEVTLEEPVKKGQCGMSAPVHLSSVGSSAKVTFSPAPQMNCRLAAQLARWVETVLQPAAREVLGSRITRIVGASSYSCRNMYSNPKLPLSEHATGSAVDIAGFVTADGRTVRVAKAWGPTERDIVAAQKKAAEAATKAAAKKKDAKSKAEETAAASPDKSKPGKNKDDAKVHKAGYKTDERPQPPVVAVAATLTAAKTSEAAFLKRLHSGACTVFGTVLGPEANEAHRDHFHFDVKARKHRAVCH